jgi:hypothetical protein
MNAKKLTGLAAGTSAGDSVRYEQVVLSASLGTNVATFLATPSSANLAAALTDETGSGAAVFATSPTLVTPVLGTPSSGTLTNCTGLPVSTGVTGFGTNVAAFLATPSSANLAAALTDETGSGAAVFANSPSLITPALGTPSSGTLTNCTGLPVSTGVTGTLPVNNGGTGATTLTANSVLLGNGTSALQVVAPGASGNVLTSNGTTWSSSTPAGGGGWVYLSTVTAAGAATADIETTFDSTYDMYALTVVNCYGTTASSLFMRIKIGGTYTGSGEYNYSYTYSYSTPNTTGAQNDNYIQLCASGAATSGYAQSFTIYIPTPASTTTRKAVYFMGTDPANNQQACGVGARNNTGALTGIRLFRSIGDITGTFRLYGIKNS